MDGVAVVLRANAIERMGNIEGAVSELEVYMGEGRATGRASIRSIIKSMYRWRVCELSHAKAEERHTRKAAKQLEYSVMGGHGTLLFGIGLLLLLGSLVGVYFIVTDSGPGSLVMMAIPGLVLFAIGFKGRRKEKQAAFIRIDGIQGTATLVSATRTGVRINNVPEYALTMKITVEGRAPYEAVTELLVSNASSGILTPGFSTHVRVHPEDPKKFVLELD